MSKESISLKEAWAQLKNEYPQMRIREAASKLGVSEAELLATTIGVNTIRLEGDWKELLKRFKDLGYVMSLTRNDACILEHKGAFEKISVFGGAGHQIGTVIGPIETRVFLKNWGFAFANTLDTGKKVMKNIQVFDHQGNSVTKIYLQKNSNESAYEELIADFKSADQEAPLQIKEAEVIEYNSDINQKDFLEDWNSLKDTHDFFPMLRKHKAHRYHALELAEGKFTYRVSNDAVTKILKEAAASELPIMIFAGNHGNLQIHQDVVKKIVPLERGDMDWINVMDPEFNLHLRRDKIVNSWVVKKPTEDGVVTSIELFDEKQNMIAQFFGLRKPGQQELTEWTSLVDQLEQEK